MWVLFLSTFSNPNPTKKMMKSCKESGLKQWLNVAFFKGSFRLNVFCRTEDLKKALRKNAVINPLIQLGKKTTFLFLLRHRHAKSSSLVNIFYLFIKTVLLFLNVHVKGMLLTSE